MKYTVTTESGKLNIRKEPSTKSTRVGSIAPGTVIDAEDYNDQWAYTTYDGVSGYVSRQYLTPASSEPSGSSNPEDTVTVVLPRDVFNALRLALNEIGGD